MGFRVQDLAFKVRLWSGGFESIPCGFGFGVWGLGSGIGVLAQLYVSVDLGFIVCIQWADGEVLRVPVKGYWGHVVFRI